MSKREKGKLGAEDAESAKLLNERLVIWTNFWGKIVTSFVKWGSVFGISYVGYLSIASLAGRVTVSDIVIKFISDLKVNEWVCYIFTGGSAAWAIGERKIRKKRVKELSDRLNKYEHMIDPQRSSSRLPENGTTLDED